MPTVYCEPIYVNTVGMHLTRAFEKYPPLEYTMAGIKQRFIPDSGALVCFIMPWYLSYYLKESSKLENQLHIIVPLLGFHT